MAIAALVLGIVGLLFSFIPCLGMYALPVTILAAILGAIGMKKPQGKGMAIAGMVCGILGTLIAAWWIYAYISIKKAADEHAKDFEKDLDKAAKEMGKELEKEMAKDKEKDKPTTPPGSDHAAPAPTEEKAPDKAPAP